LQIHKFKCLPNTTLLHKGYTKHKEAKDALKPTKQLLGHTRLKTKNNNYKLERKKVIQQ
jgi:hypothetical protein